MLPYEQNATDTIATALANQLAFSDKLFSEFLAVIAPPIQYDREYTAVVRDMTLGLHVRLVRKYRQILKLVEIGQADGAEVLCRTMFEALLAQAFICRPTIKLRRTNNSAINLHGKRLTRDFRATLFFTHDYLYGEKRIENMENLRGLKRAAKKIRKLADPELIEMKKRIGPEWAKAMRQNTCGGVSVADLAHSLGRSIYLWYRTIYSQHSDHVHPGEHRRFLIREADVAKPKVAFYDDRDDLLRILLYAAAMAGAATTEFARLLDKSDQRYKSARLFESNYAEIKEAFNECYQPNKRN